MPPSHMASAVTTINCRRQLPLSHTLEESRHKTADLDFQEEGKRAPHLLLLSPIGMIYSFVCQISVRGNKLPAYFLVISNPNPTAVRLRQWCYASKSGMVTISVRPVPFKRSTSAPPSGREPQVVIAATSLLGHKRPPTTTVHKKPASTAIQCHDDRISSSLQLMILRILLPSPATNTGKQYIPQCRQSGYIRIGLEAFHHHMAIRYATIK